MSELKITVKEYTKAVQEYGQKRKRAQGQNFNEADFITGAMVIFAALDRMSEVPALWVFGPLANREIFDSKEQMK